MGDGFTWETQDRENDIKMVQNAWKKSLDVLQNQKNVHMLILDEINIALRYKFLPISDVLCALENKLIFQHVVLTGRNAPQELIDIADLVTEMKLIKHPFREQAIKAQIGIEF